MDGAWTFKEIALGYFRQVRGMLVVLLLLLPPFVLLLSYTSMHVETALMRRRIARLKGQEESLKKKNRALRKAIAARARNVASVHYATPGSQRIVRLKLPEPTKGKIANNAGVQTSPTPLP